MHEKTEKCNTEINEDSIKGLNQDFKMPDIDKEFKSVVRQDNDFTYLEMWDKDNLMFSIKISNDGFYSFFRKFKGKTNIDFSKIIENVKKYLIEKILPFFMSIFFNNQ